MPHQQIHRYARALITHHHMCLFTPESHSANIHTTLPDLRLIHEIDPVPREAAEEHNAATETPQYLCAVSASYTDTYTYTYIYTYTNTDSDIACTQAHTHEPTINPNHHTLQPPSLHAPPASYLSSPTLAARPQFQPKQGFSLRFCRPSGCTQGHC